MKKIICVVSLWCSSAAIGMTDKPLPIVRPSTIYCTTQKEFVEKKITFTRLIYYATTGHFIKQTNNQNNKIDYFGYLILNEYTRRCAVPEPKKWFELYAQWYQEQ